jgi:hypothetical protein
MRPSPLPLLLCGALTAADQRVQDLRVLAEARPTAATADWTDRLGSVQGDADLRQAWAGGAGLRWGWGAPGRPHLLVVGAAALWLEQRWDDAVLRGPEARLEAGYGCALGNRWLLTLMPCVAAGRVALDRPTAASRALAMSGSLVEWGAAAGLRWTVAGRWSLGLEGGWLGGRQRLSGDGASLDLRHQGGWAGLALAWTLDPRPQALP